MVSGHAEHRDLVPRRFQVVNDLLDRQTEAVGKADFLDTRGRNHQPRRRSEMQLAVAEELVAKALSGHRINNIGAETGDPADPIRDRAKRADRIMVIEGHAIGELQPSRVRPRPYLFGSQSDDRIHGRRTARRQIGGHGGNQ